MTQQPPRVLILNNETDDMVERLAQAMPDALIEATNSYDGMGELLARFKPDVAYTICYGEREKFPRAALLGDNGPQWIAVGGAGVDHLVPWETGDVTVTNSAGVAAAMMAEYAFGCMLHFTLDLPGLALDQAEHRWNSARLVAPLQGRTVLIVGLGHTGQAVAARAKAFGMRVIGTRARPKPMENVDDVRSPDDLPELWRKADFVVIATPLLPTTRGIIDARAFAAMKDSAILVDVSRGGVVDGAALTNAMRTNAIAGAALDVFETEPLPYDSLLWDLENVIISPHCSSVYADWTAQSFNLFITNLKRWREGDTLTNIVDPKRGY